MNNYLDIGTEALKVYSDNKCSIEYFKENTLFDKKKALKKELEKIKGFVFLTGSLVNSEIKVFSFQRKGKKKISKKEKKDIIDKIKKEFLPKDYYFAELKVLERKIQGYKVNDLLGYNGKKVEVKVLINFSNELEMIEKTFKKVKVISLAELIFKLNSNSLIIDVGGEKTDIYDLEKNSVSFVPIGGKFFTELIAKKLNINLKDARILKEKYSEKKLSLVVEKKIKKIIDKKDFFEKFDLPSKPKYLLGGGSLLPEVKSFFEGKYLWELKNFENMVQKNKQAQCFSCFLLKKYGQEIF